MVYNSYNISDGFKIWGGPLGALRPSFAQVKNKQEWDDCLESQ
jgi:hypothetical protein